VVYLLISVKSLLTYTVCSKYTIDTKCINWNFPEVVRLQYYSIFLYEIAMVKKCTLLTSLQPPQCCISDHHSEKKEMPYSYL